MAPEPAKDMYADFCGMLRRGTSAEDKVKEGVFGAMMEVSSENSGPVTILIDSKQRTTTA